MVHIVSYMQGYLLISKGKIMVDLLSHGGALAPFQMTFPEACNQSRKGVQAPLGSFGTGPRNRRRHTGRRFSRCYVEELRFEGRACGRRRISFHKFIIEIKVVMP